jgi:hypothetical protein
MDLSRFKTGSCRKFCDVNGHKMKVGWSALAWILQLKMDFLDTYDQKIAVPKTLKFNTKVNVIFFVRNNKLQGSHRTK